MIKKIVVSLLISVSCTEILACNEQSECDDPTPWSGFSKIELSVSFDEQEEKTKWVALIDNENSDALIDKYSGNSEVYSGTIGLVGGRVMLSKGMSLSPGYEIDALDAPVLTIKLLAIILSRLYPGGPDSLSETTEIDHKSDVPITYASQSASGYLPAPWSVEGSLEKSQIGAFEFDLTLLFRVTDSKGNTSNSGARMFGSLGHRDKPVFDDSEPLTGWTVYGLGPRTITYESGTAIDYGASENTLNEFRLIGDIRSHIAEENHPGELDPTKDFTGFWKTDCEKAFGLSIEHVGSEGMYSVVFCGPGGCGEPNTARHTYITGDRRYRVVSDEQFESLDRSGGSTNYVRCTKDPRPVLKYEK